MNAKTELPKKLRHENLAAVIAAAAVVITAAVGIIVTTAAVQTAAAEQKNQNDNNPKTVVAISAEHKLNLSPHREFNYDAVPIVREWECHFLEVR